MNSEELLSKTINVLRFPLSVGIVFIHNKMDFIDIQGTSYDFSMWPSVIYSVTLFSEVLPRIAVPLFFLFSGFLFFDKLGGAFSAKIYKSKIRRREKSLLIPYLFWNFVGFLILLVQLHPRFASYFPKFQNAHVDIESFLGCFWDFNITGDPTETPCPIDGPMWYVRELMILCIFSPVIWWLIKKFKVAIVVLLGVVWFFSLGSYVNLPGMSHQAVFFFHLGAYFSINGINFVERTNEFKSMRYIIWLVPVFIIFDVLYHTSDVIHKVWILIGMISAIYLVSRLIRDKKVRESNCLANFSFFLFCSHYLIINKFMKMLVMLIKPMSPQMVLIMYFCVPIFVILICMSIFFLMKKYTPSFLNIINGGR